MQIMSNQKLSLVPEAFSKLLECFKVVLTVGVSTATAERLSFPLLLLDQGYYLCLDASRTTSINVLQ